MTAVVFKALKDLRRRRLQAAVVFVTALLAVATGTMALTLMSQTRDPFRIAFAAQKGAHLQVAFDRRTDPRSIAGTPGLIGAAAFGGPYAATDIQFQVGVRKYSLTTIGRDNPWGDVEQLRITAGHWPTNGTEIALTRSFADLNHISIGDSLKVLSVSQEPQLTVAAEVVDIDEASAAVGAQHSWMLSSAIAALSPKDSSTFLMDYRFAGDPTSAQLQTDLNTLRASLPAGTITSSVDYLLIRTAFNITNQITGGVLLAFSVFALLATAAIVANLVTGIVISAYREIGIMKALGFTPLQVESVFVLQTVIPVVAASLVAIPLGTVASQPLLANSSEALGLAYQPTFSPALDALALVGTLVIVTAAALLPAFRAGRLKPNAIIAGASAPRGRSGRSLRQLASRVRLPRPVVLGVGDAFGRPLRAILTLIAVFVGVATVTVALAAPRSVAIVNGAGTAPNADVVVRRSPALANSDATRIINADRQTARVVGELDQSFAVPGIGDPVKARIFRGDSSRLGFLVLTGRWFNTAGEVVAPRAVMHDANLSIGDRFTVMVGSKPTSLVLVGEIYDVPNIGHSLFLDWSTVSPVEPDAAPDTYLITVTPGTDVEAYVRRVAAAQPDLLDVQKNDYASAVGPEQVLVNVMLILAAVIIVIAAAAIFNTLLLNTRERIRDMATLKAIGMSPRQVMVMVGASAALLALVGGVLALPAGVGLDRVLWVLLDNVAGNDTPPAVYDVFSAWELLAIPLAGVAVAVAAALIPGRWAARTNVIEALHAE